MTTEIEPTVAYEFDDSTCTEIISCLAFDTEFLRKTDGLIVPIYFPDSLERIFAHLSIEHYRKYQEAPSASVWKELIKDAFKSKLFRDDQKIDAVNKLGEIARLTVRSRAWLMDSIADFAKQQALTNALFASAKELGNISDPSRFQKIEKTMSGAMDIALKSDDQDYDYFEKLAERTAKRLAVAAGGSPKTGVTTGVKELDDCLTLHGGWGKEELSLLMSGAKSGKSFGLSFFAANAIQAGKNVLFVTLENSIEIVSMRLDAYMSGVGISEQFTSPHAMNAGVESVAVRPNIGKLKIRRALAGTFKATDLRRILEEYKTKGIVFDLVAIDYLDIMAPVHRTDNSVENSKSIYVDVRAVAVEEKIAILSATQVNRTGHTAAVAKAEHVAEDFNRIRIADIVIAINRTEDERSEGKLRLTFAAARNIADGSTIFCKSDLDKGTLISEVESVE